jgi:hypothetical protein
MSKIVLSKAEYQAPTDLDASCDGLDPMPEFLLEGSCDGVPFACKVSTEIDGRDAEYSNISGPDLDFASPDDQAALRWDALIEAMSDYEPWQTKFQELSAAYYGE